MTKYEELMEEHDYYVSEAIKASKGKVSEPYDFFWTQFCPSTKVAIFLSLAEEAKQKALSLTVAEASR